MDIVDEGIYFPNAIKTILPNYSNLKAMMILNNAIKWFNEKEKYETSNKIKKQIDAFFLKEDVFNVVDVYNEMNANCEIAPENIEIAAERIFDVYEDINGYNKTLVSLDSHVLAGPAFSSFAPMLIESFAISQVFNDINPLMIEGKTMNFTTPDELCYEIIHQGVKLYKQFYNELHI